MPQPDTATAGLATQIGLNATEVALRAHKEAFERLAIVVEHKVQGKLLTEEERAALEEERWTVQSQLIALEGKTCILCLWTLYSLDFCF